MPLAIIAIHALQHLIQRTPQPGHFITNKAPAVKQYGRFGLVAFGQFVEAEAELMGIDQPGGTFGSDQLPSRLHLLDRQQAIERMHPPADALPLFWRPQLWRAC